MNLADWMLVLIFFFFFKKKTTDTSLVQSATGFWASFWAINYQQQDHRQKLKKFEHQQQFSSAEIVFSTLGLSLQQQLIQRQWSLQHLAAATT